MLIPPLFFNAFDVFCYKPQYELESHDSIRSMFLVNVSEYQKLFQFFWKKNGVKIFVGYVFLGKE